MANKKRFNTNQFTADYVVGSLAEVYADVITIEIPLRDKTKYAIVKTAMADCGVDVQNRNIAEMWFGKDRKEGLSVRTLTTFGNDSKTVYIPITAPDKVSKRLVRMLQQLGFNHSEYQVLSFNMSSSGDNAGILFVESKPKP